MSRSALLIVGLLTWLISGIAALPSQPQNPIVGIITAPALGSAGCVMLPPPIRAELEWRKRKLAAYKNKGGAVTVTTEKELQETVEYIQQSILEAEQRAISNEASSSGSGSSDGADGRDCIWSIYVDWLEASAIRVVPIPWNSTLKDLRFLLDRVNGVLFTGGVLSRFQPIYKSYLDRMCDIYDEIVGRNRVGDQVGLWGTCEGFQMIGICGAGRNVSVLHGGYQGMDPNPLMMKVNFTSYAASSALYGSAPAHTLEWMHTEFTTLNWHHLGIPPAEFITNPILNASGLVPLSTTIDPKGKIFVSSMESQVAAIFAVQFHPERVMFDFSNDNIIHSPHAIQIAEYLSRFLAEKVKQNDHQFATPVEADQYSIANFPRVNEGWGIRVYYI
jgi:hypothetical protein